MSGGFQNLTRRASVPREMRMACIFGYIAKGWIECVETDFEREEKIGWRRRLMSRTQLQEDEMVMVVVALEQICYMD